MLLPLPWFTLLHVLISVIGIVAGLVVVGGLMAGKFYRGWVGLFLITTLLTSITGFFFPFTRLLPSHILGVLSLVIIPVAMYAWYVKKLEGGWRRVFVLASVIALYFNAFVLIAQLFAKVPAMVVLAPTQKEPPFWATQLVLLVIFWVLGRAALWGAGRQDVRTS